MGRMGRIAERFSAIQPIQRIQRPLLVEGYRVIAWLSVTRIGAPDGKHVSYFSPAFAAIAPAAPPAAAPITVPLVDLPRIRPRIAPATTPPMTFFLSPFGSSWIRLFSRFDSAITSPERR